MANSPNGSESADESLGSRLFGKVGMAIAIEVVAGLVIGFLALAFGGEDKPIYEPPSPSDPIYEPVPPEDSPSWSPFPIEPEDDEPTDPVAFADVGDCFANEGSTDDFALESSGCDSGAFEVVDVSSGGDTDDCDGVHRSVFGYDPGYGAVLCLSYLHPWGDAYYAEPGECVTRLDDGAYATTDCDPGDFQVLERFWGEEGSYDCSEWEYYNGSVDFPGYIDDQDLLLCMRIVYPDDIGFADVDTCLYASGPDDDLHFEFADCSQSNVYVAGRTSEYQAYDFCDGYGWATWQSTAFPDHAYTVCWAWL